MAFAKENRGMLILEGIIACSLGVLFYTIHTSIKRNSLLRIVRNLKEANTEIVIEEKSKKQATKKIYSTLFWIALGFAWYTVCSQLKIDLLVISAVLTLSFGYLGKRYFRKKRNQNSNNIKKLIDFQLPLVTERIVMAVQAGHDILPALKLVVELKLLTGPIQKEKEPVIYYISEVIALNEGGLTLEKSLREISKQVVSVSLRHTFLHLAVAHRQGGGILSALSELADATQCYYQESIEEEIAVLPIKATIPLVVTFAGLLILLMTSPIIQVLESTSSIVTP
jgi:Flp pilus assembly protein TadB